MEVYIFLLLFVSTVMFTMYCLQSRKILLHLSGVRIDKDKTWRKLSFIIVFCLLAFFSAIRDGIGIDYTSYMMHIRNIQLGYPNYMEEGFKLAVRVLGNINNNPRFVIIIFSALTVFFYLKTIYDQSSDSLMSVFIFLSWGYYFFTFNTIRNYFALSLCLYSIKFLNKNRYSAFIILVLLASTIHKSALICIPLYLLANILYDKNVLWLFLVAPFLALMIKEPMREIVFRIYPEYLGSVYDTGRISYLNIIKALIVIILGFIFFERFKNDKLCRFYFHLNLFSMIYYLGFYWMPEVSRIGFYMNATIIMFIPNLIEKLKRKENELILKICVYIFSFVLFIMLMRGFYSPTIKLLPYNTWFF